MTMGDSRFHSARLREKDIHERQVAINQYNQLNSTAKWHSETEEVLKKAIKKNNYLKKLDEDVHQNLENRRNRLKDLYDSEQSIQQKLIYESEGTADDRRAAVAQKCRELKEARLKEQAEFIENKRRQQAINSNDELRRQNVKLKELETIAYLDGQMVDKLEQKHAEIHENQVFDDIWLKGIKEKEDRHLSDVSVRQKRIDETLKILDEQVHLKDEKLKMEEEIEKIERDRLQGIWQRSAEEEEARIKASKSKAIIERKKADEYAAVEKRIKEQIAADEAAAELNILKQALAKEKQMSLNEIAEKKRAQEDMRTFEKALREDMVRKEEDNSIIEKMEKEALDNEWRKRAAVWEKESRQRDELQKQVLSINDETLQIHEKNREEEKNEILRDRQIIDEEVERYLQHKDDDDKKALWESKKLQEEILRQMDFKNLKRALDFSNDRFEVEEKTQFEDEFKQFMLAEKKKQEEKIHAMNVEREERWQNIQNQYGNASGVNDRVKVVAPWDR